MKQTAKFITIEGVEGCGKSTQIRGISEWLSARQIPHIITREPGDTSIGRKLRAIVLHPEHEQMDPRCEAFIYMADRAQHLAECIKPALKHGKWVICDRYHDSTLAYQAMARGVEGLSYRGFMKPDLTLLLDLDPELGLNRAISRNEELDLASEARFEQEELAFHLKVRDGFLELARQEPTRFSIIDAKDTAEIVKQRIRDVLQKYVEAHLV